MDIPDEKWFNLADATLRRLHLLATGADLLADTSKPHVILIVDTAVDAYQVHGPFPDRVSADRVALALQLELDKIAGLFEDPYIVMPVVLTPPNY